MATAKKLPSGSWRCLVFSHYENVVDKDGKPVIDPKTKKHPRLRRDAFQADCKDITVQHKTSVLFFKKLTNTFFGRLKHSPHIHFSAIGKIHLLGHVISLLFHVSLFYSFETVTSILHSICSCQAISYQK